MAGAAELEVGESGAAFTTPGVTGAGSRIGKLDDGWLVALIGWGVADGTASTMRIGGSVAMPEVVAVRGAAPISVRTVPPSDGRTAGAVSSAGAVVAPIVGVAGGGV
jgi:hypothetical protein